MYVQQTNSVPYSHGICIAPNLGYFSWWCIIFVIGIFLRRVHYAVRLFVKNICPSIIRTAAAIISGTIALALPLLLLLAW
jgi:hypothetical protein